MTKLYRNSRQASVTYDLGGANAPRPKGLFCVRFVKGDGTPSVSTWGDDLSFLVKAIDQPRTQFKTEELNQYNKKRIVYTGMTTTPINVTFYDTASGTASQMWDEYARYYFGDFNQTLSNYDYDIVSGSDGMLGTQTGYGYRPRWGLEEAMDVNSQYYFSRIEIYQVFRNAFTRTFLINPKIISYDPEELDYESQEAGMIKMSISYESVIYDNGLAPMALSDDAELSELFQDARMHGDFIEVSGQPGAPIVQARGNDPRAGSGGGEADISPSNGGGGLFGAIKGLATGGGVSGLGGVLSSFGDFNFGKAAGGVLNSVISGRGTKNILSEALYAGTNSTALRHIASSIEDGLNVGSAVGLAQTYIPGINPAVFDAARAAIAIKNGDKALAGGMAQQAVMGVLGSAFLNGGTMPGDHVATGNATTGVGRGMSLSGVALNAINSTRVGSLLGNVVPVVGKAKSLLGGLARIPGLGR